MGQGENVILKLYVFVREGSPKKSQISKRLGEKNDEYKNTNFHCKK